jgi:hypothetical protein
VDDRATRLRFGDVVRGGLTDEFRGKIKAEPACIPVRSYPNEHGEHAVLFLGLAVLLAVAGVATFPCWSHSEGWGYRPSLVAAMLLVVIALVAAGGRVPRLVPGEIVPSETNLAVAPAPHSDGRDVSRKIIYLPRDLETTQRDTGL